MAENNPNSATILLVGLGNPGKEYEQTRHNLGFMLADEVIRQYGFATPKANKKFEADISEGEIAGRKVIVSKPSTFMNLSGQAVGKIAKFYKVPKQNIIVAHDDLELPPCKVRVKAGGGAGGHNGIKSVDKHIGNDYERIRIGIGHPKDRSDTKLEVHDYVTSKSDFKEPERAKFAALLDNMVKELPVMLEGDKDGYMNKISLFTKSLDKAK